MEVVSNVIRSGWNALPPVLSNETRGTIARVATAFLKTPFSAIKENKWAFTCIVLVGSWMGGCFLKNHRPISRVPVLEGDATQQGKDAKTKSLQDQLKRAVLDPSQDPTSIQMREGLSELEEAVSELEEELLENRERSCWNWKEVFRIARSFF